MATEFIDIAGHRIETLKELLRPGLRFIVVGLNPSPKSVLAGHYYQGVLGQSFFRRLQTSGIAGSLPRGREDDAAFEQGIGFTDLVRRPTANAQGLTPVEIAAAVPDLLMRLGSTGDKPPILFVFRVAANAVAPSLKNAGYGVFLMPRPYDRAENVERELACIEGPFLVVIV